jgi:hypothetical protein
MTPGTRFPLIPLLTLLAIVATTDGRVAGQRTTAYGLKGGFTRATLDIEFADDFDLGQEYRVGLDAGIFLEWFGPSIAFVNEVHFIRKGMMTEEVLTDTSGTVLGTAEYTDRLDYLSFPLLARLAYGSGMVRGYLVAGPRIDLLVGFKTARYGLLYTEFPPLCLGADVGVGLEIADWILLEARYSHDFTLAFEDSSEKIKNRSLQFLLGLRVPHK